MKFPQNIMVIISGSQRDHFALTRAIKLAEFYDIQLHLLSCVYDPGTDLSPLLSSSHKTALKQEKLQAREDYLNSLKTRYETAELPISVEVIWHRKLQKAVYEACKQQKPDLVIKRISRRASDLNPFTMPIDWQLLRHCPAPLLLVKDDQWNMPAPVLGAVDATSEDPSEIEFNREVIAFTKLVSRLTDAPAHLVTTHITPILDNAATIPDFDVDQLEQQVTDLIHNKLSHLAKDFNIAAENLHVVEGLAEERIPQLAENIQAQLVVMGTISREGLKAAFMGNTAERVLSHLQCEVLALKPR